MISSACGSCSRRWDECECNPDTRTESIMSLLTPYTNQPSDPVPHLCVFAYHPHQRWTLRAENDLERYKHEYSVACLPTFEGWYAAFIKIGAVPDVVPYCEDPVFPITLCYGDATELEGYVTLTGRVYVQVMSCFPPDGTDFDINRRMVRTHIRLSQGMTLEEIKSGSRGTVHGFGSKEPNNGRKVSHVVSERTPGTYLVSLLPETVDAPERREEVSSALLKQYCPFIYEEMRYRVRRRLTKQQGEVVRQYLIPMFEEARRADADTRSVMARSWLNRFVPFQAQAERMVKAFADLRDAENKPDSDPKQNRQ